MLKKINRGIKTRLSDPFWKNVATLFSGSALAQAVPILILPVITRLYSKEALGFYFVYVAIGLLSQIVASLQYQLAIVLPKENSEAHKVLSLNFILVALISLSMFLGIWLFFDFIASFIEQKELLMWLYAVPLSTFLLGLFNALSYFFNREKKYKTISIGKVTKSLTFSVFHIVFALLGFLSSGLILGLILGQLASAIFMLISLFKTTNYKLSFNITDLKTVLIKYKDIPFFNTSLSFLNTLSNQLPLFLLTRWFGAGAAGDYGLANRMVTTPMGLVGQSVGQVFYQEAANIQNKGGSLAHIVKTTYKRLFKIGLIPFIALALLAPFIFKVVFSADYASSGEITRLLIPWLFLMFLNSPLTFIITVLNKQRQMVVYDICLLTARLAALYFGYTLFNNLFVAIALFSGVGLIFNIGLMFFFLYIAKNPVKKVYD